MTTYTDFVDSNVTRVGLRKNEFERRIKENSQNHPLIVKIEKRRIEETIKPVNIPGIFTPKPKNELFLAKLKHFETNECIKKIPKSRFQMFQEIPVENIHPKAVIPDIFKKC